MDNVRILFWDTVYVDNNEQLYNSHPPTLSVNDPYFQTEICIHLPHRSIYKYLDTGLLSLNLAIGDPFKLTSPAQHASRWCMCGSQTCRLLHRPRGLVCMRHRENRRDREFMLGNSRMKLPDAMHAGQKRSVRRGRGLAVNAAPVTYPCPVTTSTVTTVTYFHTEIRIHLPPSRH